MNNFRRRVESSGGVLDPVTGRGVVDGYEVVDLGLSNGLLFATCNVGANTETGYGYYYNWNKSNTAIQQVMGEGWRKPTLDEFNILIELTDYSFVTNFNGSGINGCKFTSKTNPNAYVFFPAAGCYFVSDGYADEGRSGHYWTSDLDFWNSECAMVMTVVNYTGVYNSYTHNLDCDDRISVRGVHAAV